TRRKTDASVPEATRQEMEAPCCAGARLCLPCSALLAACAPGVLHHLYIVRTRSDRAGSLQPPIGRRREQLRVAWNSRCAARASREASRTRPGGRSRPESWLRTPRDWSRREA